MTRPLFTLLFSGAAVLLVFLCSSTALAAAAAPVSLVDSETASEQWRYRSYDADGQAILRDVETRTAAGEKPQTGIVVPAAARETEVFHKVEGFDPAARRLDLRLYIPDSLPDAAVLKLFVRDWDFLWWQVRLVNPAQTHGRGRVRLSVPLRGPAAEQAWSPVGHGRRWNQLTPRHAIEVGLALELPGTDAPAPLAAAPDRSRQPSDLTADLLLLDMRIRRVDADPAPPSPPKNIRWWPRDPRALQPLELRMRVEALHTNPFDTEQILVRALVERPDGKTETLDGFHYADFSFRDPKAIAVRHLLRPEGRPEFRVRYTPRMAGRHTIKITVRTAAGTSPARTLEFDVGEPPDDARGFVRVDPEDSRFLAYDSGEHFWGVGMNVRSPNDERYRHNVPFSQWEDEGLHLYRRLFPTYRRKGINVVEVWMSSWWLALEWIPDDIGNHGVGWMNQYRAWMLDRIFQWAAGNDIHIVLVFNNHGKFSEFMDAEWDRNPYNSKNGGFLDSATEFFDDERAFQAFKRFARYTIARWGHHPNLLMWKLFTEIDLTGDKHEFYKQPVMAQWHRRASAAVKELDPYDHIVTTHWMLSYKQINPPVAAIDNLDVLTTDAYYMNRRNAVAQCLSLLREGTRFGQRFNKPLIVTEFGGSPHADSMQTLIKQAHAGVWAGFFGDAAVAPFFWWFALTEEQKLYGSTKSLARFSRGEDRRSFDPPERHHIGSFLVDILRGEQRFLAWIADLEYYYSDRENRPPQVRENIAVPYTGLEPGTYQLEIWDTRSGDIIRHRPLTVDPSGRGSITLPKFSRDIALKIIPQLHSARNPQ